MVRLENSKMTTIITDPLTLKISRLLTLSRSQNIKCSPISSEAIESLDSLMFEIQFFIEELEVVDKENIVDRECVLLTPPPTPKPNDGKILLGALKSLTFYPTSPDSKKRFSFKTFKSFFSS